VIATLAALSVALATTVKIAPANGVATNVTAVISGTTDVSVNPGTSGGGLVTLAAANSYVGTTSLGCGTLIASTLAPSGTVSSLGKGGEVRLGPGTFRFTGTSATTDRPFTNQIDHVSGGGTKASVWDVRGDLTLTGRFAQQFGGFIKTGSGTLHLASTGTTWLAAGPEGLRTPKGISDADYRKRLVFNANGDSPSVGFSGLTVVEGKLVLGENAGVYHVNSDFDSIIGTWTAAAGGAEKSGTLEIRGGRVRAYGWTVIGQMNGNTGNTVAGRSCIRVTDGVAEFDQPVCFGRNKPGYAAYAQLTYPCWEQTGGCVTIKENGLALSDDRGACSTATVAGGVLNAKVISGRISGSSDTWGRLTVCNRGRVNASDTYVRQTNLLEIVVTNGGRFGFTQLRTTTGGRLDLLVDGGTLASRLGRDEATNWVQSTVRSFLVGSCGAAFEIDGFNSRSRIDAPIDATNTASGMTSPGVHFRGNPACRGVFELRAACSYAGPTTISGGATVTLAGSGCLPASGKLVIGADGGFETLSQSVSVSSLTLGESGLRTPVRLGVAPNAVLVCTGTFSRGEVTDLEVALYASGGTTNALAVSGSFPVLTVPSQFAVALTELRPVRSNPVAGRRTSFMVVTSGTSATLTAVVSQGTEGARASGDLVTSLGECRLVEGRYDLANRALVVTDLQHLSGRHVVLRASGGVVGDFAETNLGGTGYRAWNMGNRVVIARTQPPGAVLIVR